MDTYKDVAWITIIPFEVTDLRFNKTPSLPYISNFVELNVRTYVKRKGTPGIYFFSLDASKFLAVTGGRLSTLPYYYANMHLKKENKGFTFYSKRFGRSNAMLQANYDPEQEINYPKRNSLDEWLLERYYAWQTVMGIVTEVRIHHTAWKTQRVEANIKMNHLMPLSESELLSNKPLFHFSSEKRVLFWPLKL